MTIWMPCKRVGKPLIGSNHMHSMASREGDDLDARRTQLNMASRCRNRTMRCDGPRE